MPAASCQATPQSRGGVKMAGREHNEKQRPCRGPMPAKPVRAVIEDGKTTAKFS